MRRSWSSNGPPALLVFDPFFLLYAIPFYPSRVPIVALSTKALLDWDPIVPPYTSHVVPRASPRGVARVQSAWLGCYARGLAAQASGRLRSITTGYTPYRLATRLAADARYPIAQEWAPRPVPFDVRLRSIPEVVLHAREFDFPRARPLRAGVRYLGPCVDLERAAPASPLPPLPKARRVIFCSLGTIRARRDRMLAFFQRIIAALGNGSEYSLVIATGDSDTTRALRGSPEHVHVHDFVPQLDVLRQASLHVTHGGSSSVKESILLGVPLLVYPRAADQPGNAARVVFHGLGARGSLSRSSAPEIRRAAQQVIADREVHRSLARMREYFLRYDEKSVAQTLCELSERREARDADLP